MRAKKNYENKSAMFFTASDPVYCAIWMKNEVDEEEDVEKEEKTMHS